MIRFLLGLALLTLASPAPGQTQTCWVLDGSSGGGMFVMTCQAPPPASSFRMPTTEEAATPYGQKLVDQAMQRMGMTKYCRKILDLGDVEICEWMAK